MSMSSAAGCSWSGLKLLGLGASSTLSPLIKGSTAGGERAASHTGSGCVRLLPPAAALTRALAASLAVGSRSWEPPGAPVPHLGTACRASCSPPPRSWFPARAAQVPRPAGLHTPLQAATCPGPPLHRQLAACRQQHPGGSRHELGWAASWRDGQFRMQQTVKGEEQQSRARHGVQCWQGQVPASGTASTP